MSWHASKKFNDEVLEYHNRYARQPNVDDAKAKLESLKLVIKNQMNNIGDFTCLDFRCKGSTYEGVKIKQSTHDCPEFDLDFVIKGGECLVADESDDLSWHELRVRRSFDLPILNKAQDNGVISPSKVIQLFYGSLSKCDFIREYNIKLRYHGPAVQMDVQVPNTQQVWFQVDLAPAFYLEGNNRSDRFSECYVAKSPDNLSNKNMWYRSYSTDEKRLMDTASGQRKVVLRTLKVMRARSPQFLGLQSYHLKMSLFHVMKNYPNNYDWSVDKLGQRLINVLEYMQNCLESREMPNYFNRNLNILKLNPCACSNLANRIGRLISSEQRMSDFLNNCHQNDTFVEPNNVERQTETSNGNSAFGLIMGMVGLCLTAYGLSHFCPSN